jgi:hypothetical protein
LNSNLWPIRPHFAVAILGILLLIIAEMRVRADLGAKEAMPEAPFRKQSSLGHWSSMVGIHRKLYPKSPWLYVGAAGVLFFLSSPILLFLE